MTDSTDAIYMDRQGQKYARYHRRGGRAWQHDLTKEGVETCEVCGKQQTRSSTDSKHATSATR